MVTKTFTVSDSGLPTDDGNGFPSDFVDTTRSENDYKPARSTFGPQPSLSSAIAKVSIVVSYLTWLHVKQNTEIISELLYFT